MDSIAWAMKTGPAVYMIKRTSARSKYLPSKSPVAIKLDAASPSNKVTVMDHSANQFSSFIANMKLIVKRVVRYDVENCQRLRGKRSESAENTAVDDAAKWQAAKKLREVNPRCAVSTAVEHGAKKMGARPSRGTRQVGAKNTRARPSRSSTVQATRLQNHKLPTW